MTPNARLTPASIVLSPEHPAGTPVEVLGPAPRVKHGTLRLFWLRLPDGQVRRDMRIGFERDSEAPPKAPPGRVLVAPDYPGPEANQWGTRTGAALRSPGRGRPVMHEVLLEGATEPRFFPACQLICAQVPRRADTLIRALRGVVAASNLDSAKAIAREALRPNSTNPAI